MRVLLRPSVVLLAAAVVGVLGLTAATARDSGVDTPGPRGYTFSAAVGQQPPRETVVTAPDSDTNVVIGADERVQVTDTVTYPGGAIAYLETYRGGLLQGTCTGTFIGPDTLLTAAHCLYLPDLGWVENIAVVPGKNGVLEPFGYDWALDWWVPDAWVSTGGNLTYDWGVIKMPSDVLGTTVGWLTVANLKTDTLSRADFFPSIIGYPGDKPNGTMWLGLKEAFTLVKDFTLEYEIDTAAGQSGSAIMSGNLDEWFGAYVVGVHTFGGSLSDSGQFNSGQRIDSDLLSDVLFACTVMACSISSFVEAQPTPIPSPTVAGPTPTVSSATPNATSAAPATPTKTVVATPTPTATTGATTTPRPTIVRAPTWTPGPTWTPIPTWTPNAPPTATPTPTFTSTPTNTPTNTPTSTPPALTGDTSCDGGVNPLDAALILQLSAGLLAVFPCPGGGDTNGDGSVNPLDAALILQFSAGLISSLPP